MAEKPKKPQKQAKNPHGWFDRREMCAILDVSEQQFNRKYLALASADAQKTVGRKVLFKCRPIIDAMVAESVDRVRADREIGDEDPLMGGGERSPALEKYRNARATLAEMDVAERGRTIVNRNLLEPMINGFCKPIRSAIFELRKRFGNDAGDLMNEAVDSGYEFAVKAIKQLNEAVTGVEDKCRE